MLNVSGQEWKLIHEEDFSSSDTKTKLTTDRNPWMVDKYEEPFDTIMDDPGLWYINDYGPAFTEQLDSFDTYRKEILFGTDDWLTASLSARDWNKDGVIETEPVLKIETSTNEKSVLTIEVDDHTGGAIVRPTKALPDEYRIEFKLTMIDFGGKRNGSIEYDNRVNGYSAVGCKTQHPWGEGSKSQGWTGNASVSYCEWQDVRRGRYGYNGFHFLSIVDFANPAPRNNHFWHYRRKVLMDAFSQHPDRVGDGPGGQVCNVITGEYTAYRDSSFNTINMWISGLPNWRPGKGGLAGNKQLFMTSCNGGVATRGVASAAELQPEVLEIGSVGNFSNVDFQTLRYYRPFVVDDEPIWHYNIKPEEYDGRYNGNLQQIDYNFGNMTWHDQWPAGSAYPDYFVIGDLYTNVYEGRASLTDIKYFEPDRHEEDNVDNNNTDDDTDDETSTDIKGPTLDPTGDDANKLTQIPTPVNEVSHEAQEPSRAATAHDLPAITTFVPIGIF
eukprot:CAMPEP_0178927200 /NCGR_PEP_ID=MMETSP0786-20121207/19037_1 /TAXON_ID=186022 /ORGANISM="Thalassionema frauenfeldii, Strain CCMP 1798" /LENGTH=498 /DNA_ID=CAMNT_0020602569 /DNA_START=199 /DNA_END=1693 /DNA_ORIENTATION=-